MFERLSSQAGRTPAGLGAASAGCESAANARRLRRHPVGRSRCMIAKPPCANYLSVPQPAASTCSRCAACSIRWPRPTARPSRNAVSGAAGLATLCATSRARSRTALTSASWGSSPSSAQAASAHWSRVFTTRTLTAAATMPPPGPPARIAASNRPAGPSPRPRGTGLAATDLPGYMNRLFSRRSRTLACPVAGTCPDASGASLAGTWCSVRGATGRVSRRTGSR
jgi:hypothetical protein